MQNNTRRRDPRSYKLNAALFIFALILSCLAVETVLRVIKFNPYGMMPRRVDVFKDGAYTPGNYWGTRDLKRPSPFPGIKMGEYIPGLDFRFVYASDPRGYFGRDNAVEAHINGMGTRGPEFSLNKPAGVFRIIGLGDSFTFGEGARAGDVFLSRLEKSLNKGPTRKYEVINCGVSGYNTRDEALYLEKKWIKLRPDLVLLVFVINDGYDEAEFGPLDKGFLTGAANVNIEEAKKPASLLLAWMSSLYERRRISKDTAAIYLSQFSRRPRLEGYSWDNIRKMLARAAEVSRANHAHFALIIFPELYKLNDDYPFLSIHQQVKQEAEKSGVPVLDLYDAFYGMKDSALWVHPTDHHPNEKAHAIASEAILKFISDPKNDLIR